MLFLFCVRGYSVIVTIVFLTAITHFYVMSNKKWKFNFVTFSATRKSITFEITLFIPSNTLIHKAMQDLNLDPNVL